MNLLLYLLLVFTQTSVLTTNIEVDPQVYICVSKTASVYHQDRECRGLQACTHQIKRVSVTAAIDQYGRRACKVCY